MRKKKLEKLYDQSNGNNKSFSEGFYCCSNFAGDEFENTYRSLYGHHPNCEKNVFPVKDLVISLITLKDLYEIPKSKLTLEIMDTVDKLLKKVKMLED